MIRCYQKFPTELFRINNGNQVYLRPWTDLRPRRFDVYLTNGYIEPKALHPITYKAPNGASMRPNSPYQQYLMEKFEGDNIVVFAVPRGTMLPKSLVLVHERADHWSLQTTKRTTLEACNQDISFFLQQNSSRLTVDMWKALHPKPTCNVSRFGDFSAATP